MVDALAEAGEAKSEDGEAFGVWPENWDIVAAFLAVITQFRVITLSTMERAKMVYLGLDYMAARAGLSGLRIRVTPELWAGICAMEAAYTKAMNRGD